jgi:hypothetical protein
MTTPEEHPAPVPEDRASLALALSECEDELALRERAARRHQYWSLLPGVGVTTFWIAAALLGVGSPSGVLAAIFGIVTAREGGKQYRHQVGLRACRERLAELRAGGSAAEAEADEAEADQPGADGPEADEAGS